MMFDIKGRTAPPTPINIFCTISNNKHLENIYASYTKLFKKLKNCIYILVDQSVVKFKTVKMLFSANNSRTA